MNVVIMFCKAGGKTELQKTCHKLRSLMDLEIFENCTVNTSKNRSLILTETLITCPISLWRGKEYRKSYAELQEADYCFKKKLRCSIPCNANKCP